MFEEVGVKLKKYGEKQRKYYNLSIYGTKYKPGDLVYLREKLRQIQVCCKLAPKWRVPYMVVRRFGTVYEILTALKMSKLFHFDLLKPCNITDLPQWIKWARKIPRSSSSQDISMLNPQIEGCGKRHYTTGAPCRCDQHVSGA